jgi:ParB family transcriptional regulator, chromosome partitioning protein
MSAALPTAEVETNLVPGNVKVIKNANRRSDSLYFIDSASIHVIPGYNVRFESDDYNAHVRSMADSMKAEGFHADSPLVVYVAKIDGEDRVTLIRGHSRMKALALANDEGAGITEIPVIFKPKTISPQELEFDLIDSNNGRNLTTYETAIVVKRLMNLGITEDELLAQKRFSPPQLQLLITLASAPPRLAELVASGQASAKVAVELIRKHGPVAAQRMALEMVERARNAGHKQLTVRNLPQAAFKKALKKAAPRLHEATSAVTSDPGYSGLAKETRALLEAVLGELKQPEAA